MNRGFAYLLTDPRHAVRLATSLWSLRQFSDAPAILLATRPESLAIAERIAQDLRLRTDVLSHDEPQVQRNAAFFAKITALRRPLFDQTVYLDADTVVVGDVGELVNSNDERFTAVHFAEWTTTTPIVAGRIEPWKCLPTPPHQRQRIDELIDRCKYSLPGINGGVVRANPNDPLLAEWESLAYAGQDTFVCDEISLQLLLADYPHRLLDGRFDCSPVIDGDRRDVRIWHFHGSKHLRRPAGRVRWLPWFEQAWKENAGGVQEWAPAGDGDAAVLIQDWCGADDR